MYVPDGCAGGDLYLNLISSPDTKVHVRYWLHLASVIVCKLLTSDLLLWTTWPIWTKLGRNVHWMVPDKDYGFFCQLEIYKKTKAQRCPYIYIGINDLLFICFLQRFVFLVHSLWKFLSEIYKTLLFTYWFFFNIKGVK